MNLLKYTSELIKVTMPIVLPVLKKHKSKLVLLLFLSILLGFIPSIKSGIESNFLNESNRIIESSNENKYSTFKDVLDHTFNETKKSDFLQDLPNYLTNRQTLLSVIIIYIFAVLITFVFEYYNEKIKISLVKYIFVSIREASFKKALCSNPSKLPQILNASGNISSSIQIGTGNISNVYDFLADLFQYIFLLLTSLLVLFSKAWLFGFVFLFTLLFQVLLSVYRAKKLKKERKELEKQRNTLVGQTEDIISKKEIILAFEQEDRYTSKISNLSNSYGELSRSLELKGFVYSRVSNIIYELERFAIPILAIVSIVYFDRQSIANIGGVFFLITLYSRLTSPILSILSKYDSLKENEAISSSLLELLNTPIDGNPTSLKNDSIIDSAVTFDNVSFSYDNVKMVFEKSSFSIPKNNTTLILGPSGCGKSSITKIILGYWPIKDGIVSLMGQPITSYSDKEIRLFTSYISQDDYIVDETIRENLNWSNSDKIITDKIMMDALVEVKLIKTSDEILFLDRFAKNLSGGEKQRLCLARIILDDAELLLLDEPLTGVDVYTIRDIMPIFKQILESQNRTVVLISHKLSFASSANHVVLLDNNGSILEQGNPKSLAKDKSTTFYKLYETAIKEFTLQGTD